MQPWHPYASPSQIFCDCNVQKAKLMWSQLLL